MKHEVAITALAAALAGCTAYNADCPPDESDVVGYTATALDLRPELVRTHEAPVGNLVADAYFAAQPEAELALVHAGAIRDVGCHLDGVLDPGPVTMGQLEEMLPFENELVLITVSGEDIRAALEWSVGRLGDPGPAGLSRRFLQVSHLRVLVDCKQRPADGAQMGQRVDVYLARADGSLTPLDDDASYDVATTRFLAEGGEGFESLKVTPSYVDPTADVVHVARYIESQPDRTVAPTVQRRILLDESCTPLEP